MEESLIITESKPEVFPNQIEVAACYVESHGKLLLLKRSVDECDPETWGVPGGCMDAHETPLISAHRELREETGIDLPSLNAFLPLGPVFIQKGSWNLVFHLFKIELPEMLPVSLSNEHTEFLWASQKKMATLDLIPGFFPILNIYQKRAKSQSK